MKFLRIRQTLARIKGGVSFQAPKTKSSVRTIEMPDFVLQALKGHKIRQMEERLRLGTGYKDTDLVAADWNEGNIFPEQINKDIKEVCKKISPKNLMLHLKMHPKNHFSTLKVGKSPFPKK